MSFGVIKVFHFWLTGLTSSAYFVND
jgi:hypothetical protein